MTISTVKPVRYSAEFEADPRNATYTFVARETPTRIRDPILVRGFKKISGPPLSDLTPALSTSQYYSKSFSPLPASLDSLRAIRIISNSFRLKVISSYLARSVASGRITVDDKNKALSFLSELSRIAPSGFFMPVVGIGGAGQVTMFWKNDSKRLEAEIKSSGPTELFCLDLATDNHWEYDYTGDYGEPVFAAHFASFFF